MSTSKSHDLAPTYDDPHVDEHVTATPPERSNGRSGKDPIVTVQPIRRSDVQPSYAYTAENADETLGTYGVFRDCLGSFIGTLGTVPCCPCPSPFATIEQGQVGLVSKFGRFVRAADPGLVRVNPVTEDIRRVDIKVQVLALPKQLVLTRDNVSVTIDSVIVWSVVNPYRAAFGVGDVRQALSERAQTTLRQVVGSHTLQQTITEREAIALEIEGILERVSEQWGVHVESLLLKDVQVRWLSLCFLTSSVLSRASAVALVGGHPKMRRHVSEKADDKTRLGEAKVIAARAEVDSARLMREAADILSSPAAIQIRQLEALQNMARSAGAKTIFIPMSLQSLGSVDASQLAQSGAFAQPDPTALVQRTALLNNLADQ